MPQSDDEAATWTPIEVAKHLSMYRDGEPDPQKLWSLAYRRPDFPRPRKIGRLSRYVISEIKAWCDAQPRGGPAQRKAKATRRGPKPKASRARGAA